MAAPLSPPGRRVTTLAPAWRAMDAVASLDPSSTTTSSSTRPDPPSLRWGRIDASMTRATVRSSSLAGRQTETRRRPLASRTAWRPKCSSP